jgi:hypothetical protein
MRKIFIILICFCINSIQCSNRNGNVPQIIKILEKEFDHTFIRELKEMPENIVPDVFFSYFLYQFQEKIEGNNEIDSFFQKIDLFDKPSQAYFLLFLWHKELNKKEVDIKELINMVNDPKNGINSCYNKKKINSIYNYKKFNTGENINLLFPVRLQSEIESTVYYGCPIIDWEFDAQKDISISGLLINKYFKGDPKTPYFQLKIKSISRKDVLFLLNSIHNNDTLEINIEDYGIKI